MFDSCDCHNSSLWTEGPLDVELCDWRIIRASVPPAVLALSLPFRLVQIISQRNVLLSPSSNCWSKLNIMRLTVTLVVLLLNILFSITESCSSLRNLLIILACLTAVLKTCVLVSVLKTKVTTSKTILCFWLVNTATYLPDIIIEFNKDDNKYLEAALLLAMVLSAGMLVLQCLVYQERETRGEDGESYAGQLVFAWLDFLFVRGFKHEIPATDIPSLPRILNVRKLIGRFEKFYQAGAGGQGTTKLLLALSKAFGLKLLSGAVLEALNNIVLFISPLIIQQLLGVIESEADASVGYFWSDWSTSISRLDPRNCWRQLSYAIKNQLGHPKPPTLVLYGIIRAPIIGPFRAWKPPIPYAIKNERGAKQRHAKTLVGGFGCDELVLYGIRELAEQHYEALDR